MGPWVSYILGECFMLHPLSYIVCPKNLSPHKRSPARGHPLEGKSIKNNFRKQFRSECRNSGMFFSFTARLISLQYLSFF